MKAGGDWSLINFAFICPSVTVQEDSNFISVYLEPYFYSICLQTLK